MKIPWAVATAAMLALSAPAFAQVSFDFEDGGLPSGFEQSPAERWGVSTASPLAGSLSLRCVAPSSVAGVDKIALLVPPDAAALADTLRLLFRHSYSSTISASNRFAIFFGASAGAESMSLTDKR